jgi:hypothetical protein
MNHRQFSGSTLFALLHGWQTPKRSEQGQGLPPFLSSSSSSSSDKFEMVQATVVAYVTNIALQCQRISLHQHLITCQLSTSQSGT